MAWLIDTNVFLRTARRNDPDRQVALDAIQSLRANNEILCYTTPEDLRNQTQQNSD
jgi:predicted nucleic acid-binding protein